MEHTHLQQLINQAWEDRATISPATTGSVRDAVNMVMQALDKGDLRVAYKENDSWKVQEWLKKAVLLYFRLHGMRLMPAGWQDAVAGDSQWYDKVPSKFAGWQEKDFAAAAFRAVPGCIVRHSAHIARDAVLMPSFVNVGAYVGEGTMVDTWATVGSCAQVGKNCHISGGAGIGGVLEPLQASPVIIEDNCFIGARSEVAEGVIIGEGSVLSMGVYIGASTKIVDRTTGAIYYGQVPPYSVVVSGTMPSTKMFADGSPTPALYCAVIVKRVDERTRSKTSINELLRL